MRTILINARVAKELKRFEGKELQWIKAIVSYLEDDTNSRELIEQKFKPLGGSLVGYRKAKNRSLGIRMIFRFLSHNELELMVEPITHDEAIQEFIELLTVGRRDKVYQKALEHASKK